MVCPILSSKGTSLVFVFPQAAVLPFLFLRDKPVIQSQQRYITGDICKRDHYVFITQKEERGNVYDFVNISIGSASEARCYRSKKNAMRQVLEESQFWSAILYLGSYLYFNNESRRAENHFSPVLKVAEIENTFLNTFYNVCGINSNSMSLKNKLG